MEALFFLRNVEAYWGMDKEMHKYSLEHTIQIEFENK